MAVLCIVPTALRASRAARRLCDAQRGVLLGARVSTLDATAAAILAAADGRPVLSPLAERLLCLEAAAASPLLAGLAPGGGLAHSLSATVWEARRAEVRVEELRAAASALGGRAGVRLASVAAVLEAYERRLAELGVLDRAAAVRVAAGVVERGTLPDALRDLDLLVLEGYPALSSAAFDLVVALAQRARRTHVRLPFFPHRSDLCGAVEPLVRRLEGLHQLAAARDVEVALEELEGSSRDPRLASVLRGILGGLEGGGGPGAAGGQGAGGGHVLAAAGPGEEGEAEVAAGILASLLERGFAAEDVLVIDASGQRGATRLARACSAVGVPLALGHGTPLSDAPPVRVLREALTAAVHPRRETMERLLSSSYLALARPPPRLPLWLDRAGALDGRGDPEQALRARAAALVAPGAARERAALVRSAEALASAGAALRPLSAPGVPAAHAARLRGFVSRSGLRRRAGRGEPELVRRDLEALARLDEVTEDLVRALGLLGRGGEALTADRWGSLLDAAVEGAAAPPAPEPAAGVEVWPLSEAPGLSARAALVTGCARGAFPACPQPEPLLGDLERTEVHRVARRSVFATAPSRRADARHGAFCALAAGREALALTWPATGPDGSASSIAPLVDEVLALAGLDPAHVTDAGAGLPGRRSVAQALRSAARLGRARRLAAAAGGPGDAPADSALVTLGAALEERAASALARGAVEQERLEAVLRRRAVRFAGAIPPALRGELHRALPEEWTPSQLEEHARCPFRFFAASVLSLSEPDAGDVDIDPRDEGKLAHAILELFYRRRLAAGALPLRGAPEERQELALAAAELCRRFEADGRTGDPAVWAGRRAAVLCRLERVIEAEAAEGDEAVPALLEYRFGGDAAAPPLVLTAAGGEVRLRGRLDRVDATADRLVLVDYKDSRSSAPYRKKLAPEALGETNFQVPAYLMAAARALPGRARLEATYLLLRSAERLSPFVASAGDPFLALEEESRAPALAAGRQPFAEAVVSAVRRIRGGELPIASRDCSGCSYGAVCRFESRAEDET